MYLEVCFHREFRSYQVGYKINFIGLLFHELSRHHSKGFQHTDCTCGRVVRNGIFKMCVCVGGEFLLLLFVVTQFCGFCFLKIYLLYFYV